MGSILVVDDEDIVRFLVRKVLESADHCVTEAHDGLEALEKISASPNSFDVIILDLLMPRMNGVQFLEAYKGKGYSVPILVLSTSQSHFAQAEPYNPSAFMVKPFNKSQLIDMVRHMITYPHLTFRERAITN